MSGLNELGVLDSTVRKLREGLAVFKDTLGLHLETTLLRHGGVPNIVRSEEGGVERDIGTGREAVLRWVVGSHVNDGIDVRLASNCDQHDASRSKSRYVRREHRRSSRK